MKPPTASIYPELPTEDGQTHRLSEISRLQQKLDNERDDRKLIYKQCKRGISITDGIDTTPISISVVLEGVAPALPFMLPLETIAIVLGTTSVCLKFVRHKFL